MQIIMEKQLLILMFWFITMTGISQVPTITLSFNAKDAATQEVITLESVTIQNMTLGCDTTIPGPSPVLTVVNSVGIDQHENSSMNSGIRMLPAMNPSRGKTVLRLMSSHSGLLVMNLHDLSGKVLSGLNHEISAGWHLFEVESANTGVFILNASLGNSVATVKLISNPISGGVTRISYIGTGKSCSAPITDPGFFKFRTGDQLSYKAVKNGFYDTVIFGTPSKDTTYTFSMVKIPVPPSVLSIYPQIISYTTATAGGNVTSDGGAMVTGRGYCWSTSLNPAISDFHTIDGAGIGLFTSQITGLEPHTMYYGRAYATNSAGTGYGIAEYFITPPLPNGYYIMGSATAHPTLHESTQMKITRNEVTQMNNPDLLEIYIPVKAGSGGFCIVQVGGPSYKYYGPEADFITITQGSPDEPEVPFQRGSFAENSNWFTVPSDGMYHVAIYLNTNKVVVVPVHWGIIGWATINGWANSVPMPESDFSLTTMSWSIDSLLLRTGEWKFRYSNGWKVEVDTTVLLGGGNKGIKVNANFGETVTNLVPGGANIINTNPGFYTCTLSCTLGSPYQATLVKTGSLPLSNWTGVVCDAIGTGVSPDNPTATPDTSAWNWGYQMLGDNSGIPVINGSLYTWTWDNIIIEAYKGFKVRTLNGLPPPVGGAYFDAGYPQLNTSASAPQLINGGGNIMSVIKASYKIILHINAANNDAIELIITKN